MIFLIYATLYNILFFIWSYSKKIVFVNFYYKLILIDKY